MKDAIGSKSTIRNFMGNASRTTCNDYLYAALQDADEALERFSPKKLLRQIVVVRYVLFVKSLLIIIFVEIVDRLCGIKYGLIVQ